MTDCQTVYLELPLAPSVNQIWRSGKGRVFKSAKYRAWLTEAGLLVSAQLKSKRVPGFVGVIIKCVKPSKRKMDLDNRSKALLDLLVSMNVIDDDCMIQRLEMEWVPVGAPMQVWVIATREI